MFGLEHTEFIALLFAYLAGGLTTFVSAICYQRLFLGRNKERGRIRLKWLQRPKRQSEPVAK
jgi:hypothetical protein